MAVAIPAGQLVKFKDALADARTQTVDGLVSVLSANEVLKKSLATECQSVDVNKTIACMELVGELLHVAYAGSVGFQCNNAVLKILTTYMPVVKDTRLAIGNFLRGSFEALDNIRNAIELAEADEIDDAITLFAENADIATTFATKAKQLETACHALYGLAETALQETNAQVVVSIQERDAAAAKANQEKINAEKYEATTKRLEQQIAELKEEEAVLMASWDEERQRRHTLAMTEAIIGGIGSAISGVASAASSAMSGLSSAASGVASVFRGSSAPAPAPAASAPAPAPALAPAPAPSPAPSASAASTAAPSPAPASAAATNENATFASLVQKSREHRRLIMQQEAENAGKLAAALQEIKNAHTRGDSLKRSVNSLEAAKKALGQIAVAFANVEQYWKVVASTCQNICDAGLKVDAAIAKFKLNPPPKTTNILMVQVEKYAKTWCALTYLSYSARAAIQRTDETVDRVVGNLPNEREVDQVIAGIGGLIARIEAMSPPPPPDAIAEA